MRIDVLNGVNLDVLGRRDPKHYGHLTLSELETRIYAWGNQLGINVRCRQTNDEGEFVGFCHDLLAGADGAIVSRGVRTINWSLKVLLPAASTDG